MRRLLRNFRAFSSGFKMRHKHCFVRSLVVVIGIASMAVSYGAEQPEQPTTNPAGTAAARTAEAVALVRKVAQEKPLRLSTESVQPPDRFHFVIRLSKEVKGDPPQYTEYVIVKNQDRVGVLIRSSEGLPYCYLTEGLMVVLDRAHPGGLALHVGGAPLVYFRMAGEDKLDFRVTHSMRANKAVVDLDVGPILQMLAGKVRSATYEWSSGVIVGQTQGSALMLTLPAAARPGDFGLRNLVNKMASGQTLALLDAASGVEPPLDLTRLSRQSLMDLGLPIRQVEDADREALSLLVPHNFGADEKERQAATKLLSLLSVPVVTPAAD